MKFLIVTKLDELIDTKNYDGIIRLNENYWENEDILIFIPNREIIGKGTMSICFIPFSFDKSWDYKEYARAIRYKLGNDECTIVDTNFTYKIHQKIGLSYTEEANILLLGIDFLLSEDIEVIISHKIDMGQNQNQYLEELIKAGTVKVLYE